MGKYLQKTEYILLLPFRPDRLYILSLYLLSHYFYPKQLVSHFDLFLYFKLGAVRLRSTELRRTVFFTQFQCLFLSQSSFIGEARRSCTATKTGGERGIRTLDAPFETYMISNHAPSTTQTPLQEELFLRIQLLQCYFNITWSFLSSLLFSAFFSNLSFTRIFCILCCFFFTTSNGISKVT